MRRHRAGRRHADRELPRGVLERPHGRASGVAPITRSIPSNVQHARSPPKSKTSTPKRSSGAERSAGWTGSRSTRSSAAREAMATPRYLKIPHSRDGPACIVGTGIGGIITFWQVDQAARRNAARVRPAVLHSDADGQRGAGADLDDVRIARTDLLGRERVRELERCASRSRTADRERRHAGDGHRRQPRRRSRDIAMGGFCSMKALSTRNDEPKRASRPFDASATGSCWARARRSWCSRNSIAPARAARESTPKCSATGSRPTRYNFVAVDPGGSGVELACERAFASAGIAPADVDYINAHGTSTPIGDPAESKAIERSSASTRRARASARPRACTATRSAPPAGSRALRRVLAVCTTSCRRRSTTNSPIPSARSTTSRTSRARAESTSRSRTRSVSAATTASSSSASTRDGGEAQRALRALLERPARGRSISAAVERAFVHERPSSARARPSVSNERLEFLGDSILGSSRRAGCSTQYPEASEGELTVRKAALVSDAALAKTARAARFRRR